MASVVQQVQSADDVICQNIATSAGDRGFLSQNVLAQLRNLVEGLIVWAHLNDGAADFHYSQGGPASDVVRATAKFRLLSRFHHLLQASASHYTLDRDPSERLMLKYYECMLRTRDLALQQFGIVILANLEAFPVDLDPCVSTTRRSPLGSRRYGRLRRGLVADATTSTVRGRSSSIAGSTTR